jgi:hypothetical protein
MMSENDLVLGGHCPKCSVDFINCKKETTTWDDIFEYWLHGSGKSHIDLSLEEVNSLKNWLRENYNVPTKK